MYRRDLQFWRMCEIVQAHDSIRCSRVASNELIHTSGKWIETCTATVNLLTDMSTLKEMGFSMQSLAPNDVDYAPELSFAQGLFELNTSLLATEINDCREHTVRPSLRFSIRWPCVSCTCTIVQHARLCGSWVCDRPSERAIDRAIKWATEQGIERVIKRAFEQSTERAFERPSDRSSDRASDQASDRASERPSDRANNQLTERASDRPTERLSRAERVSVRKKINWLRNVFQKACVFYVKITVLDMGGIF